MGEVMPAIRDVVWERDPHTAAKHQLLYGYLNAWFPIMSTSFARQGIRFVDGFAGPGEYTNSGESSPVIAMRQALARRSGTRVPRWRWISSRQIRAGTGTWCRFSSVTFRLSGGLGT